MTAPEIKLVVDAAGSSPLFRHQQWALLRSMASQELRSRYQQSTLALSWSVVQPVLMVVVYAIFFKGILDVGGGPVAYLSFILAGLVPWRFVATGLGASTTLSDNVHVISKVYFPRELMPLAHVMVGLVDLAVGAAVLVVVATFQGYPPSVHIVVVPLAYLLVILVTCSVAIVTTTLAVFIRDVAHAMPMVLQLAFFATPIMYPSDQLPSWLGWLSVVNPVAVAVEVSRVALFEHRWPALTLLGIHLVVATGALLASIAYVRSVEHRLVDVA